MYDTWKDNLIMLNYLHARGSVCKMQEDIGDGGGNERVMVGEGCLEINGSKEALNVIN